MHHQPTYSKDSHLRSTSIIELNSAFAELFFWGEFVPSEIKGSVAEVTGEFSSGNVPHDGQLQNADKEDDLDKTRLWHGGQCSEAVGDVFEGSSIVANVAREAPSSFLSQVSEHGKHTNATMLQLNVSQAVKLGLVAIGHKAKRIVKSKLSEFKDSDKLIYESRCGHQVEKRKETICRTTRTYRRLGTKGLVKASHGEGGGRSLLLSRGERGSAGDQGGDDSGLHGCGMYNDVRRIQQDYDESSMELPRKAQFPL